jgi:D-3-phosphoglycerate dehydrogenase
MTVTGKKILFVDTVHPYLQEQLTIHGFICEDGSRLSRAEILKTIGGYEGVVIRSRFKIDEEILNAAVSLKFIARAGAGMENIDLRAAEAKKVVCLNAPEGNRNAVAEHAMGMLLALMNNIVKSDKEVRKGVWLREANRGTELAGKTVGIIGFGNTGRSFAEKLTGFHCNILVNDPYITLDEKLFPGITQVSLDVLLRESDVISLHVPLTEETRFMVNQTFIDQLKKKPFLINTSRGKVVETAAVVFALETQKIRGIALDVLEFESLSFENIEKDQLPEAFLQLCKYDQVILSPHIAGWSYESHHLISEVLAKKILALP